MRQIGRRLRDGRLELLEVPEPDVAPGELLIRTEVSVISSGTERSTLEVARKGLLAKARARPDQAKQVVDRVRRDGLRSTLALVRQRLDEFGPLGYSAAGTVIAAGADTAGFRPGDRVAAAGAGFANHAEVDAVPALLCARVPDGVESVDAAFATVGAIALHGFRRGEAQVGSTVAVIGLGLIGQLAVRIARAAGCGVVGVDLDPERLDLARVAGAEAIARSDLGQGHAAAGTADAVLICASADTSDPIELAAELARDRAPVVVVGDVDMKVPRAPYYEKELDLRLSRSYGPGRYDPEYELHGRDYPAGYVRWTEGRNMAAFLGLVADGRVTPSELLSARYALGDAERAFDELVSGGSLAIALDYEGAAEGGPRDRAPIPRAAWSGVARRGKPRFGLIGAGSFATGTVVPGLVAAGLEPGIVASARGLSAADASQRLGFADVASGPEEVIAGDVDLVVIATQHDTHADLAAKALDAGRATYVEKPLSLDEAGLEEVVAAQRRSGAPLVVGFNRRHSDAARKLRKLGHPRLTHVRVNAGPLPADHWSNDPRLGGGRLLGEGCHFVDFVCDQAESDPRSVTAVGYPSREEMPVAATDNFSIQIEFEDGGAATIGYSSVAATGPGKERVEVSAPGAYAALDDFRELLVWRGRDRASSGSRRQDKGFAAQYAMLAAVLRGEEEPPDPDSYVVSTLATLAALRSLQSGRREAVVAAEQGGGRPESSLPLAHETA